MSLKHYLGTKSIECVEFSVRATNALYNIGITKVGQLLDHTRRDLSTLGIPDEYLDSIEEELLAFRLSLRKEGE